MELIQTIAEFRERLNDWRSTGQSVGLVPTMGYLHAGHQSLFQAARGCCDAVAGTIFVNPLQFAPTEDLDAYPRDLEGDLALAEAAGARCVFAPSVAEMYPQPTLTTVSVAGVSATLEGEHRPTHFDGVATVVAKLFNIAGPCSAFFGEKDFQQVAVIRRLVADLNFPTEIVACPTVRESDGLALSSRNVNLTPQERSVAPSIYQALCVGADRIASGERDVASVEAAMLEVLRAQPLGEVDYVRVIDSLTLQPLNEANDSARLVAAVRFSRARLIDNIGLQSDRVEADRNQTDRLRGTTA